MRKYDAVIFDLDGTLLDTLDDLTNVLNTVMERHSYSVYTREAVREFVGSGVLALLQAALPPETGREEVMALTAEFKEAYAHLEQGVDGSSRTKPYPGICEVLNGLAAAGVRLAVASNKFDALTKRLCSRYFPAVSVAMGEAEEAGVRRKPHPDMIFRILSALDVPAGRTLYVGDSEVDILTAAAAGLDILSVSWGFRSKERLAAGGAVVIIDSPMEILQEII